MMETAIQKQTHSFTLGVDNHYPYILNEESLALLEALH